MSLLDNNNPSKDALFFINRFLYSNSRYSKISEKWNHCLLLVADLFLELQYEDDEIERLLTLVANFSNKYFSKETEDWIFEKKNGLIIIFRLWAEGDSAYIQELIDLIVNPYFKDSGATIADYIIDANDYRFLWKLINAIQFYNKQYRDNGKVKSLIWVVSDMLSNLWESNHVFGKWRALDGKTGESQDVRNFIKEYFNHETKTELENKIENAFIDKCSGYTKCDASNRHNRTLEEIFKSTVEYAAWRDLPDLEIALLKGKDELIDDVINSSKSKLWKIINLKAIGTKKSLSNAWDILITDKHLVNEAGAELLSGWDHFPIKSLKKALPETKRLLLAALKSNNLSVLSYLNETAVTTVKKIGSLYTNAEWKEVADYLKYLNRFPFNPSQNDFSKLWKEIVDNYFTNEWNCGEHFLVKGDKTAIKTLIERNLLGNSPHSTFRNVPPVLLDRFSETYDNDSSLHNDRLISTFTFDFVTEPFYLSNNYLRSQVYSLPNKLIQRALDKIDTCDNKETFSSAKSFLIIHLWIHGQAKAVAIDSLSELCNIRYGIWSSLIQRPLNYVDNTESNRRLITYISGIPVIKETNFLFGNNVSNEEWTRYWQRLTCMADQEVNKNIDYDIGINGVSSDVEYINSIIDEFITKFSFSRSQFVYLEFLKLVSSLREKNIRSLVKNNSITENEAEKLLEMAHRYNADYGWSEKEIVDCFDTKKTEKELNDIKANIEPYFMSRILKSAILWILQHRESELWLDAPWLGMRFFANSFNDRPSVWAKQLVEILDDQELEPDAIIRITFALGHLREPLGGTVPIALERCYKNQSDDYIKKIIKIQRDLFGREDFNKGHHKKPEKRVGICREELIKAQNRAVENMK